MELKGELNPAPLIGMDKKSAQYYSGIKSMSDTNLHKQLLFLLEGMCKAGNRDKKELSVLDLGCGEGAFSQMLFDAGYKVTAVDVNSEAFKAKGPEFSALNLNSAEDKTRFISSREGKYDVIFAVEVIEHLENPWELVRFLRLLAKDGAEVIVTTPNISSWWGRLMFLLNGRLWGFDNDSWLDPGHINPIGEIELTNILNTNGLRVNTIYPCGRLPVIWLLNWKRAVISIIMLPLYLIMKGQKNGWVLCFHATCKNSS
jgi:2-polyprenyl-3-methyl-5-hydroxy-6-metoxy-1,4-benzoquinol methylase